MHFCQLETCIQIFFIKDNFSIINILKSSLKYLMSSICMFIISIIIGGFIDYAILSICVQVTIGVIVYFSILYLTKDVIIQELKVKFMGRIKWKKS